MADEKKRQKKLMKKKRKDKNRKKKQAGSASSFSSDPRKKVREARQYPVYECLINSDWKDRGLAHILVSRRQPDGNIVFGVYLVDIFCLGVKNAFCNADFTMVKYRTEVKERIKETTEDMVECPLALAHQIIYEGIEYASSLGFRPHKDFELAGYVLEGKDALEPVEDIEFGKDGMPFYISGPDDNPDKIMRQLEKSVGKDNFRFITGFEP
ncbi:MAG: hypothetical protein R6V10_17175 [bacterium]